MFFPRDSEEPATRLQRTKVKHASAHLLVMYVKMPPKFRTWWKAKAWRKVSAAAVSATGLAAAAEARAACAAMDSWTAVSMPVILSPVASAMTLPLDCSHAHLSVSGPNQRGIFLKRPELLKAEVALEAEALRWWREEVRKGVVRPGRVTSGGSSSETGEGDDVDILMAGEMLYAILYASSLGMTRIVSTRYYRSTMTHNSLFTIHNSPSVQHRADCFRRLPRLRGPELLPSL